MSTLLEMRQRAAAVHEEMKALHTKAEAENRDLSAEERTAWDKAKAEIESLRVRIERDEEIRREVDWLNSPAGKPPLGGNSHSPQDSPWPVRTKNGLISGEWLQAVYRAAADPHHIEPKLLETRNVATGMNEGAPSEGGFLVNTDQGNRLLEKTYSDGQILSRCDQQPIGPGSNGIAFPKIVETARTAGNRWGGIRFYWESEGATATASAPKYGKFRLDLDKILGIVRVTDELLQDAVALEGYISRMAPKEMRFKLEDSIINGSGAGVPQGVVGAPCTVSIAKETGQTANTVLHDNLKKMWARCFAPCRPNCVWFINQDVEPQLDDIAKTIGTAGVEPSYVGYTPEGVQRIKGRPVVVVEHCQTLGTVGDIILADLSQYMVIDKGGIQMVPSIHVYFTTDEMAFRFVYRVNGGCWWDSALTPAHGTNTQSCFLTLATRA